MKIRPDEYEEVYFVECRNSSTSNWYYGTKALPTLQDAELFVRTERIDKDKLDIKYRIIKERRVTEHTVVATYGKSE